jgi:hypothetical protein
VFNQDIDEIEGPYPVLGQQQLTTSFTMEPNFQHLPFKPKRRRSKQLDKLEMKELRQLDQIEEKQELLP